MAHHDLIIHPLVLRCVHVTRIVDVTPRMRRVTLSGEQLAAFSNGQHDLPAFASPGFDDHVKLIFASDSDIAQVLPEQLPNGIEWAPAETRQGRDYTPRRFDAATGELDLDFVMHGDGPAASWAQRATVGAALWFAGPKSSTVVPDDADWVLLAGDETALPAIGRYFDERPSAAPVRAVITIADARAKQEFSLGPNDQVEWVIAPEHDERALAEAVAKLQVPGGTPYVWAAAESRALLPVRKLAKALGAAKSHTNITGYWHKTPEADAPGQLAHEPTLPEMPITWFAVRAALSIGLLDALAAEPISLETLAARLRATAGELDALTELLVQAGLVTRDDQGLLSLDRLGEELCEDEHEQEHYVGCEADQVLALQALPEALGSDRSAWEHVSGSSLRTSVETNTEYYEELVDEARGLPHVLTGLTRQAVWGEAPKVAVTGPGALEVSEVLQAEVGASITVFESAGPLAVLRQVAHEAPWAFAQGVPEGADLVATALAFGHRSDAEVVSLLRSLAGAAERLVLIERLSPDGLSPAASAAQALVDYAVLGVPTRTPEATLALVEAAGWSLVSREKLGWGIESLEVIATAGR
ncbi:siderophore-interacting protein [Leucobacter sp. UCMA 4100]|uniref:siderophore-interacting protein n=1 Tax=Leucobacter sp. UCMA 4100 TaxID=2810534 RepID=UPI0022EAD881|nr:siderophore-interacting protein [Leucobacter sp. UCMA 4100]MDA3146973.1 siderophore-interacting protein [Leucobacter sp. UCMA 4100]